MSSQPVPGGGVPPAPVPRKGLPVWAWIGIGCGTMMLVAALVFVVVTFFVAKKVSDIAEDPSSLVKFIIDNHPDFDLIEMDTERGKVTVLVKETGEEVTFDFEDVKEGRLSISSGDKEVTITGDGDSGRIRITGDGGEEGSFNISIGEQTLEGAPGWLPIYPGASSQGSFSLQAREGDGGSFALQTVDSIDQVIEHYHRQLKEAGFTVEVHGFTVEGVTTGGTLVAEDAATGRMVRLALGRENDKTTIGITYNDPTDE